MKIAPVTIRKTFNSRIIILSLIFSYTLSFTGTKIYAQATVCTVDNNPTVMAQNIIKEMRKHNQTINDSSTNTSNAAVIAEIGNAIREELISGIDKPVKPTIYPEDDPKVIIKEKPTEDFTETSKNVSTEDFTANNKRVPTKYIPKKQTSFKPKLNKILEPQLESTSFVGEVSSEIVNGNILDGGMAIDNKVVNAPKIVSNTNTKSNMKNASKRKNDKSSSKEWGNDYRVNKKLASKKNKVSALSSNAQKNIGVDKNRVAKIKAMEAQIEKLRKSNTSSDYSVDIKDTFAPKDSFVAKDANTSKRKITSSYSNDGAVVTSANVSSNSRLASSGRAIENKKGTGEYLKNKKTGRQNLKALNLIFINNLSITDMVGKEFMTVLINDTATQKLFLSLLTNPDVISCENLSFVENFFIQNLEKVQTTSKGASELLVQSGEKFIQINMPNRLKVKMMKDKHCSENPTNNTRHTASIDPNLDSLPEESNNKDQSKNKSSLLGKIIDALTGN